MKLEWLSYMMEIEKRHSIHSAADSLGVSQQNLSAIVKSLEKELGISLFERSVKGVKLSTMGEELLPHFEKIVKEYDVVLGKISEKNLEESDNRSGTIHFACSNMIGRFIVPQIMEKFNAKFANVNVIISEFSTETPEEMMAKQKYDVVLYFVDAKEMKNQSSFETYSTIPLLQDSLVIICDKDSEIASSKVVSFSRLSKYQFIFFSDKPLETIYAYQKLFLDKHISAKAYLQCNIESSFFKLIQGDTLSAYSKISFKNSDYRQKYNLTYVPLKEKITFYYIAAANKTRLQTPYVKFFVETLQTELQKYL